MPLARDPVAHASAAMRRQSVPDQQHPALLEFIQFAQKLDKCLAVNRRQDAAEKRGEHRCHRVRKPGHRRGTAVSSRSDGAARVCGPWVPRLPAPKAAATRRTHLRTRSARSRAVPFFYLWPALLDPALDRRVVAFYRSACRSLPTPAQPVAQDVPHPCGVVRDPSHALDHFSHAFQGPHIVDVAVGCSALGERCFDLGQLLAVQLGQPSGASRPTQTISPSPTPHRAPIRHDLMAHAQLPGDLGWTDALLKQVRGTHPALLHRRKITPRTYSAATRPRRVLPIANSSGSTHSLVFAPTPTSPVVAA